MISTIKKAFIISFIVLSTACKPIISGALNGIGTRNAKKFTNKELGKDIIFIPYANKTFSWQENKTERYLEKMKQQGYCVYRDGVLPSWEITDSIENITTANALMVYGYSSSYERDSTKQYETMLKQRKISGAITEWDNPISNKCQFYQNSITGREDEYWIDLTLGDLLHQYEADFGTVKLSEYDYSTPMETSYVRQVNDTTNYHLYEFVSMYRMDNFVEKLAKSPAQKIIIVADKYYLDRISYKFKRPSYYGYSEVLKFKIRRRDYV